MLIAPGAAGNAVLFKGGVDLAVPFKGIFGIKEYDSLVDFQSIKTIDLLVRRLDGTMAGEPVNAEMIAIKASPDKYTWYMRNYVGKNVASFGYTSWGGDRMDEYGAGYIKLNFVADDGTYLDPSDYDLLKQYAVTRQDIKPNTEIHLTFMKDSEGKEYSNLVQSQSYESITLYVHRLNTKNRWDCHASKVS